MTSENVPEIISRNTPKSKSLWSALLSILGLFLFIGSYFISENPTAFEKNIIKTVFFSGIASILFSVVLSILAIKANEKGFLKYLGFLLVALVVIGIALVPVLMALLGFNEP